MENPYRRPALSTSVCYRDPWAALEWLEKAFGFERAMVITGQDGSLAHSEMRFSDSVIYVGAPWTDFTASPAAVAGKNTQMIHIQLRDGIDAHCARARAAGAVILQEPADQFYGDRTYRARDPEGHVWTVAQTVRQVSRAEAEQASGLKIEAPEWH